MSERDGTRVPRIQQAGSRLLVSATAVFDGEKTAAAVAVEDTYKIAIITLDSTLSPLIRRGHERRSHRYRRREQAPQLVTTNLWARASRVDPA